MLLAQISASGLHSYSPKFLGRRRAEIGTGPLATVGIVGTSTLHRRAVSICRPDGANGLFLAKTARGCGARLVHVVPAFTVGCAGDDAHAGHLHVPVRVVLTHPFPRVTQPVVARVFRLLREPRDFIPAPNPEAALARFAGAAAAAVDGVGVARAQLRFLRFGRKLLDAQR